MINHFKEIFEYENWANSEIIMSIEIMSLPNEKILSLMSHIVNAQILWMARVRKKTTQTGVWDVYNKEDLLKKHDTSAGNILNYIKSISESDLNKNIEYTNSKGEKFSSSVKDILTHLSHHSAYHRGQLITQIKSAGADFPYTDYIHYIRKIKK